MKQVLFYTTVVVPFDLSEADRLKAQKLINKHFCGEEDCNTEQDGKLVAKYPEIEKAHPEWLQAHRELPRTKAVKLDIAVCLDGSIKIYNPTKKK